MSETSEPCATCSYERRIHVTDREYCFSIWRGAHSDLMSDFHVPGFDSRKRFAALAAVHTPEDAPAVNTNATD